MSSCVALEERNLFSLRGGALTERFKNNNKLKVKKRSNF
jgi:hypothetical protein